MKVFQGIKNFEHVETIFQNYADPYSKGFNPTTHFEYYFDAPGHNTEDC